MVDFIKSFERTQQINEALFSQIGNILKFPLKADVNKFPILLQNVIKNIRLTQDEQTEYNNFTKKFQELHQKVINNVKLNTKEQNEYNVFAKNLRKDEESKKEYEKLTANIESGLEKKHRFGVESGEECAAWGTQETGGNRLFWSQIGSPEAWIGPNKNHVTDITEFLPKRALRCFDIKKDQYGISWLFSPEVKFEALKIWGNPKNNPGEVYFAGDWFEGEFKGIKGSPFNLKGGIDKSISGTGGKSQEDFQRIIKPLVIDIAGILEINSFVEILTQKELDNYNIFMFDIQSGKFLNILRQISRAIRNKEINAYSLIKLFFFQDQEPLKLDETNQKLINYLISFKKNIINNIVKKDGSPNEYYQNAIYTQLSKALGIKKPQQSQQTTSQPQQTKPMPRATVKENLNTLSVKEILLQVIKS